MVLDNTMKEKKWLSVVMTLVEELYRTMTFDRRPKRWGGISHTKIRERILQAKRTAGAKDLKRKGLHALGPWRRPVCFWAECRPGDEGQAGSGSLGVVNYLCLAVLLLVSRSKWGGLKLLHRLVCEDFVLIWCKCLWECPAGHFGKNYLCCLLFLCVCAWYSFPLANNLLSW